MFALITILAIFSEGSATGGESGFTHFYNEYFNIPGFEAWKFLNLAVFIILMTYFLKKPLSDAFKAKREVIRAELIKAEEEKNAAVARLTKAEANLAQLETEKENILERARAEAKDEAKRITDLAEQEAARILQQAQADLERIEAQKRVELRRFSAEESIRLAEEKLRQQIDAGTDVRLVKANIQEIGGLN